MIPFLMFPLVPSRQGCEKAMRLAKEGVKLSIRGPAGGKGYGLGQLAVLILQPF